MCTRGSLCVVLVQSLLDEPNPNSPANSQAAQLYQENKREYEKRVTAIVEQSWVDVWEAPPPAPLLLSIGPPPLSIARSFLPHRDDDDEKKKDRATLSEELKCHPEKKEEWNNQTTVDI